LGSIFQNFAAVARLRRRPEGPINVPALRRELRKSGQRHPTSGHPTSGIPKNVTVIIPCYGHAPFLRACLDSILRQTRLPDEVVAVLDDSPDDSERILLEYRDLFVRAGVYFSTLKNIRNIGQAATINRGVQHASSELMMVLNDDDILFDDSIWLSLRHFEVSGPFALMGGSCVSFSEDEVIADYESTALRRQTLGQITIHPRYAVERYSSVADFNITHSGMTFLKEAWKIAGGYQSRKSKRLVRHSDRDFQFRMNCYFPTAVLDDSLPLAFWRRGSSVDKGLNS